MNITPCLAIDHERVDQCAQGVGEIRDRIVEAAVQKSMGVLEFSAERVSLEEIFLQLTTEENL